MTNSPPIWLKFGPFEANLSTGELLRNGSKVPIQQKPFDLLVLLLRRPGELVTRAELQDRLWPDTFVQRNLSLNTAIRKLRVSLGERRGRYRFIETVGSRGYRFNAQVAVSEAPASSVRRQPRVAVLPFENLS